MGLRLRGRGGWRRDRGQLVLRRGCVVLRRAHGRCGVDQERRVRRVRDDVGQMRQHGHMRGLGQVGLPETRGAFGAARDGGGVREAGESVDRLELSTDSAVVAVGCEGAAAEADHGDSRTAGCRAKQAWVVGEGRGLDGVGF